MIKQATDKFLLEVDNFYFIRHGQTEPHLDDPDIPLNTHGLLQATMQKPVIADLNLQTICVSPLHRARQTASIFSQSLKVNLQIVSALQECTSKVWHSMTSGTNLSEPSTQTFFDQVKSGITTAMQHPAPVLIVAHGGIHYALCRLLDIGDHPWIIDNCELVRFKKESHQWQAEIIDNVVQ